MCISKELVQFIAILYNRLTWRRFRQNSRYNHREWLIAADEKDRIAVFRFVNAGFPNVLCFSWCFFSNHPHTSLAIILIYNSSSSNATTVFRRRNYIYYVQHGFINHHCKAESVQHSIWGMLFFLFGIKLYEIFISKCIFVTLNQILLAVLNIATFGGNESKVC